MNSNANTAEIKKLTGKKSLPGVFDTSSKKTAKIQNNDVNAIATHTRV